jgi:pimeloyl-ACP methyl ester carboxylesterase
MTMRKALMAVAAALSLASTASANADPVKNIVLVHGAWVDASGWKPVYQILTREGFHVTMVQEPETSFADDVTATKRILDLQDGPTLLVGHSYGGLIITEAGIHPNVVGLVYVAAHAPDVGEDEGVLGKKMPSVLAKTEDAIKKRRMDSLTSALLTFPSCSRPICHASKQNSSRVLRCWLPPRFSPRR